MTHTAIVHLGAGNTASVLFALERLGADARITADPVEIAEAERLVLPGVGAAGYAMEQMAALGLTDIIKGFERPLLGLCLGQQLLFAESEENGGASMLGFIPGRVTRMPVRDDLPVPHMGWSQLHNLEDDPLLQGVVEGDYAYFVHSYACPDTPATIACADYGAEVPAMVRTGNRWGCQFHPERSAKAGARILKNFLELPA
ncbi:imidazole glycerol phosphate synthase subunit HisH [Brevundimonas subvibrioides]|uniref:Imidazole glycerol phosphate synthase subunit HisH n=1 Tax=Brevundimonas subvibrioides (strain ATCC 15264 / DSM 4735 / LMG 14903 / NBRC 16000 / CB 81) TaxID=633149 RepID=D9QNS0_BRESC|nr:imidazole glycerol phosphate synthase subunit HisH [Brevundimonas subvibrioides]ADL00353.1 imidazole glycerol phosphate synthase, glutamine amidotransferase subunit [Brevundimonas subvibrioides ATCC 15264]